MRHCVRGRKLNRTSSHRLALRRNLCQSLFEHGEVRTTAVKAREVRSFAEKLMSLAVDGSYAARQRAEAMMRDRSIIPADHREDYDRMSDAKRAKVLRARSGRRYRTNTARLGLKFTAESVLNKLFSEIGPALAKRNEKLGSRGGYTRIIKLADRRLGDGGQLAILQIVGDDDEPRTQNKDKSERKRRARVKYTVYAGKPRPQQRRRSRKSAKRADDKPATQTPEA